MIVNYIGSYWIGAPSCCLMDNQLKKYFSLGEAISLLLHPHGEVVIHDLQKQTIAAIFLNLSKRKIGDESLLEPSEYDLKLADVFPIYSKMREAKI